MILNFGDMVKIEGSDNYWDMPYVAYELGEMVLEDNTIVKYVDAYGRERELVIPKTTDLCRSDNIGSEYVIGNRFNTILNNYFSKYASGLPGIVKILTDMLSGWIDFSKSFVFAKLTRNEDGNVTEVSLYCNGMAAASVSVYAATGYCRWDESDSKKTEALLKELHTLIPILDDNDADVVIFPCTAGSVVIDRPLLIKWTGVEKRIIEVVLSRMISVSVYIRDFDNDDKIIYKLGLQDKLDGISHLIGTEEDVVSWVKDALMGKNGTVSFGWYVTDMYNVPMYMYRACGSDGVIIFEGSNDDCQAIVTVDYGIVG